MTLVVPKFAPKALKQGADPDDLALRVIDFRELSDMSNMEIDGPTKKAVQKTMSHILSGKLCNSGFMISVWFDGIDQDVLKKCQSFKFKVGKRKLFYHRPAPTSLWLPTREKCIAFKMMYDWEFDKWKQSLK